MMMKGHLRVATAVFLAYKHVSFNSQWEFTSTLLLEYIVVMFGSLLPDIDHPRSTLGRKLPFLSYPINKIFGHRKMTHSILFVGAMFFLGDYFNFVIVEYLAIGAALHLLGDYLTPSGIPLFYPFGGNYRAIVNARTNRFGEHVLSFGSLALAAIFLYHF
jgi:inner membrane protein